MDKLSKFLELNRTQIENELIDIVDDIKDAMRSCPEDYIEPGMDTPSVDIRLCIDTTGDSYTYIFRTGLVDYDQYHSEYCGASWIGLETSPSDLLDGLIIQIEE